MSKIVRYYPEGRSKRDLVQHIVYGKQSSGSPGDYILMKKDLTIREIKERNFENQEWYNRVMFTTNWLEKKKKENGNLICVFCGKKDLVIYPYWYPEKNKDDMATADHFIPVSSKLIEYYNEEILVVSCESCNSKKGKEYYSLDKIKYCKEGEYKNLEKYVSTLLLRYPDLEQLHPLLS